METIYRQAIRREKKDKASGPEGVPMKILQKCPAAFAELMFELFATGARLQCVMKIWEFSILIPINKKKVLMEVPANNRPPRLILILRKIFDMGTTVGLVEEYPDELEQYGFNEKSMPFKLVAMVLSAATMRYGMSILLHLIKSYDLVQRDQVMAIVDEKRSVEN